MAVLPTLLTTTGILGLLACLLIIAIFFFQGFGRTELKTKEETALLVGIFYFFVLWFFYSINLSLMFTIFLLLGLWTYFRGKTKEVIFTKSPQTAFIIMLLGVFLIAGSVFGIYNIGRRYSAALSYAQGLSLINREDPNLDASIVKLDKACQVSQEDACFRNLSQVFLLKINEIMQDPNLSQEERQSEVQKQISNAEVSATLAVEINPGNHYNWMQLASVYENLTPLGIEATSELGILNYKEAQKRDPYNPLIALSIGRMYKLTAELAQSQILNFEEPERQQVQALVEANYHLALEEFNRSLELKFNFSPAYYLIAQVYEQQGNVEKALENYQTILKIEPNNEEILQKIKELNG